MNSPEQPLPFIKKLPAGWSVKRFEELLAEPTRNGIYKKKEFHGRGQKIINMGELFDYDFISNQEMKRVELNPKELEKYLVEDGDLLFARRSLVLEGSGKCSLVVKPLEKTTFESSIIRARLNKKEASPEFYYYLFRSPLGRALMASIASQTAVSGITGTNLLQLRLPQPPISTQHKICNILSNYDRLIKNNTRRIQILEEIARSLHDEWFVRFRFPGHEQTKLVDSELGLIPQGWEVGSLEDALVLQRGFDLPTKQRKEGSIPIYASTGITGTHNEVKVKAPGVVTGRSGSLGTVIYVNEDFWPLNTTLWVKEFRKATPIYAFYLLSSLGLEQYNSGAAVPTLNRNDIHGLPIVIPSSSMLQQFNYHVEPMLALKRNLIRRNENLRQSRDLLLTKLISGEVDVENLEIDREGKAIEVEEVSEVREAIAV
ncbi:restriction endonuclease subunit S [Trichocoleus desertorum AS-A10]|uniref:restriction endonuclease subunit S n=1 Tax=Trichocoleus desertorum TaxID=1481672 RepID=UPI003298066D